MSTTAPTLVWFRLDLRLTDNPALHEASLRGRSVIPVFIWSPEDERPWTPGGASQWWLHQSLTSLARSLEECGSSLILRRGPALATLRNLIRETGASAVFWNRRYEPAMIARDKCIKEVLREDGVQAESFNGSLLHEPWTISNKSSRPFQVFTPFWKTCLERNAPDVPLPAPRKVQAPKQWPHSDRLEQWQLQPTIPWDVGMRSHWQPGEGGADRKWQLFLANTQSNYSEDRNRPDRAGTSGLSPHLHFGEISPRQIWQGLRQRAEAQGHVTWAKDQFVTELGWREFAYHLLFHFPSTPEEPLRPEWKDFPTLQDGAALQHWCRGQTGYPIVDAGMRELWTTGWMHNRVRMISASFVVKDLFLPWQEGARWFWDTLVDADLAANTLGWQWTAGCGADAAPYFRIFNPVSQGQKFDPDGVYVRKWVPELSRLPTEHLHSPWEALAGELRRCGVELGRNYPLPIVDHAEARNRALAAYSGLRNR